MNVFGPMPAARVIHVIRQLAFGSRIDSSLVHRDIKRPTRRRYGEAYGIVKASYFGIAKTIHANRRTGTNGHCSHDSSTSCAGRRRSSPQRRWSCPWITARTSMCHPVA